MNSKNKMKSKCISMILIYHHFIKLKLIEEQIDILFKTKL